MSLLWHSTGQAQQSAAPVVQGEAGITSYPASFFTEQGTVTVMEMIQILPGFAFQNADNSRGYSGNAGNVMINGRRPSTKTMQLRMFLRQIPASLVDRIEIIRAGTPGFDLQGLPVIANVVRKSGASSTGNAEILLNVHPNADVGVTLRTQRSRRDEKGLTEGTVELRRERVDTSAGDGPITRFSPTGLSLGAGRFEADHWGERAQGSAVMERDTQNGLFRANLALNAEQGDEVDTTRLISSGVLSQEVVDSQDRERSIEIGADYEGRTGARTGVQFLAIQRLEWETEKSTRLAGTTNQRAKEGGDAGETILRGAWRWTPSSTLGLELGAEGAYNFLDAESALTRNGVVVNLPAANVKVEEQRGELFSTLTLQPNEKLSVDAGLRAEISNITVSGDANNRNEFSFIKPRVQATWSLAVNTRLRVGVEREVGQLDFDDFAAGSEFADDTVNAGNVDLEPERAWAYTVAWEQTFPGGSATTLSYKRYEIEQVIDLIPVQGFAAPGNIGSGTRNEYSFALSTPLGRDAFLGRIQFSGTWRNSSVTDPVTGQQRGISAERPFEGEFVYTRDFPKFRGTLGMRGELTSRQVDYRLDQIIASTRGDYWRIYWDWRARSNLLLRAQVENFTSRDLLRERQIFSGSRATGLLSSRDSRSARFDPLLLIRARWTF